MHLASLHLYPVKALRGLSPEAIQVDDLGAVGDRRFMVVDSAGVFMTQRSLARMARVGAFYESGSLALRSEGLEDLRVRAAPDPKARTRPVAVWKSEGLESEDCGDQASEWLTRALGMPCRLVRIGPGFRRPVTKAAALPGDLVSFADAAPFLIAGTSSLDDLNARLVESGSEPVPMDRFRPNLVVGGSGAFEEDRWVRIRIGEVVFRSLGPCARCVVTDGERIDICLMLGAGQYLGRRAIAHVHTIRTHGRSLRPKLLRAFKSG